MLFDQLRRVPKRITLRLPQVTLRLPQGDGARLAIALTALIGVLLAVAIGGAGMRTANFFGSGSKKPTAVEVSAAAEATLTAKLRQSAEAAAIAKSRQEARERQVGSIVFVTRDQLCEELKFDNVAEQVISVKKVDCEERLAHSNAEDAKEAKKKAEGMHSVLAGFKR